MKKILFFLATAVFVTGCVNTDGDINFERMSTEELAEYNSGRNIGQMIVCTDDTRSLSRVRRRRCGTVNAMYGSEAQADQLGVLNTVPGIGQ
ncbi:MAG: hypothetical protein RL120_04785 [Gammaproteobacteria bacterium]